MSAPYPVLIFIFFFASSVLAGDSEVTRPMLARYLATRLSLRQNAKKEAEFSKDIAGIFAEIRSLRFAKKPAKEQAPCDVCVDTAAEYCNRPALHPEFCREGDCKIELEPRKDICYRIYRNDPCYKSLSPVARAKVNECWQVDNHLTVKELEIEIDSLKKELDQVVQEKFDLMKYELAIEEECPKCPRARVPAHFDPDAESEDFQ